MPTQTSMYFNHSMDDRQTDVRERPTDKDDMRWQQHRTNTMMDNYEKGRKTMGQGNGEVTELGLGERERR